MSWDLENILPALSAYTKKHRPGFRKTPNFAPKGVSPVETFLGTYLNMFKAILAFPRHRKFFAGSRGVYVGSGLCLSSRGRSSLCVYSRRWRKGKCECPAGEQQSRDAMVHDDVLEPKRGAGDGLSQ